MSDDDAMDDMEKKLKDKDTQIHTLQSANDDVSQILGKEGMPLV